MWATKKGNMHMTAAGYCRYEVGKLAPLHKWTQNNYATVKIVGASLLVTEGSFKSEEVFAGQEPRLLHGLNQSFKAVQAGRMGTGFYFEVKGLKYGYA